MRNETDLLSGSRVKVWRWNKELKCEPEARSSRIQYSELKIFNGAVINVNKGGFQTKCEYEWTFFFFFRQIKMSKDYRDE